TAAALEQELKRTASQILRIPAERLATDENLQDFGFDSISLVEFAGTIAERFGIDFTPDLFFSYTNLEKIHEFLLSRHGEKIAALFGAAPAPEAPEAPEPPAPHAPRSKRRTRSGASRFAPPPVRKRRAARAAVSGTAPAPAPAEEPIAIIGMSGRFPSARTVDELWTLLAEGRSAIGPVPADDPHRHAWWADGRERRIGRLPGIAEFDPFFFEIAPSEAETMDPRQRLLLEEMWKALEDAACGRTQLEAERVGVFVGVEEGDYRLLAAAEEGITSNHNAVLASRLSYFLNLTGPGIAINTACSSSLLAVHEACLSLRHGDCDTAIVAGVNLMATPREYDALDAAGMLSPAGVCRAFDRRADGMVPGEAVAAIVLKKRDAAEHDGHPVYASIIGSGINNDGRTNGITAPSGHAQTRLIEDVHRRAGISPESVEYLVTHGTGTRLGDPVEINALAEAFRPHTPATGFCALTSTKPNVGHTLAASGLVSLIGLTLAMRHETIPPSINCEQISDFVSWPTSPFYVNREPTPWPEARDRPRRGGVSAFGFSGTNAHVLLESHGTRRADLARLGDQPAPDAHLLVLSAKTDEALARALTELADRLAGRAWSQVGPGLMASVSYTLMAGRHHFARRCAFVVRGREEAVRALRQAAATGEDGGPNAFRGTVPRDIRATPPTPTSDLAELARRYCRGHDPDPAALWGDSPPERMSLPTYPFDNRDYWVATPATPTTSADTSRLHPLVHENTSDVRCERFASAFTGEESWWTGPDGGMSAGALLELARAAAVLGLGEGEVPVTLHDVVCYEPATTAVHIDLQATAEGGALDWALYADEPSEPSQPSETSASGEPYLACDGRAVRTTDPAADPADPAADSDRPGENAASLTLELPDATGDERLHLRPDHLDACLAAARAHLGWKADDGRVTAIAEASFAAAPQPARRARITLRTAGAGATVGIDLATDEGAVVVRIRDLTLSRRRHELPDTADLHAAGAGRRPQMRGWSVPQCVEWELKDAVSQLLKFPMERLNDLDANLATYGFDSLNLSQFAVELSRRLDLTLTPDLFFSHPTLGRLKTHLLTSHAERMHDWYRGAEAATAAAAAAATATTTPAPERKRRSDRFAPGGASRATAAAAEPDSISIIGMSGRFPDARTIDELWSLLAEGRSAVREVPEERRETWGDQPARLGWLPGVAEFDPLFFEISPREAELMDPRQRLLLEEMWKALEDAGYGERRMSGERVGVFVGVEEGDYRYLVDDEASLTSNSNAILASRLAYFLNLAGPSMAINTSCSSGLVALHEACLSLRYGDCDTAIVAAASVMSSDHDYVGMRNANMLSPDGTCYAFDRRANGMVPGEAVAVLVLKRRDAAERDGHPAYATILGSGVNYDGRTNGITAPNGEAQARLLTSVYDRHRIAPDTLDYLVTHGTGTKLGDPIEVNALADAFRSRTDRTGFCALTSVKPNLGHSMAASGLVSLVTLVTAMKKETIPPSIHCDELSAHIRWEDSPFFVNRTRRAWPEPAGGHPRRGAVSSFGMSGTNAHVVLQAAPTPAGIAEDERPAHPHHLLVVSAKTEDALAQRLGALADHLERGSDPATGAARMARVARLASVSRTLMSGRHHFAHRCALVAQDREDAVRLLRQAAEGARVPRLYRASVPRDFAPNRMIEKVIADLVESRPTHPDAWQELLLALAEFYCQGHDPAAFEGLWDSPPRMIPGLPPYPFAAERYWAAGGRRTPARRTGDERLHPLVHAHDSDGTVHRFSSQFTGREDFLSDLLVSAERN
ncbi:beta-ketoacyl synthase N-terminal-like domain-containing protein, partial [Streptomyces sp. 6N223]|uniref:beta-ketoacyl synthase N-terminal-like domain-containing protein n=1 Tax=Streptomyces sp. 6N223 TaxID=3457412 RepID=UPI003FD18DC6